MHSKTLGAPLVFQPYGRKDQAIYSVSRVDLNRIFLDEVRPVGSCSIPATSPLTWVLSPRLLGQMEKHPDVQLIFDFRVTRVQADGTVLGLDAEGDRIRLPSRLTIGADGAFSTVRRSLIQLASRDAMESSLSYIPSGYKEFSMEPADDGGYRMNPYQGKASWSPSTPFLLGQSNRCASICTDGSGLHIWPRGEFMFIALPNPDHSFTVTLFAPWRGKNGLLTPTSDEEVS